MLRRSCTTLRRVFVSNKVTSVAQLRHVFGASTTFNRCIAQFSTRTSISTMADESKDTTNTNGGAGDASKPSAVKGISWTSSVGKKGEFIRKASSFRDWVKADGSTPFTPEAARYVLYVSMACPWAHRTLIMRRLKGLEDTIDAVVVHPLLRPGGWRFKFDDLEDDVDDPCVTGDKYYGLSSMSQLYEKANPEYSGHYTVPVLWDTKTETIVNNESAEIIRMLNSEFNEFASESGRALDFYPEELRDKIDAVNEWVYPTINNGVYRCGFARTQVAYNEAYDKLLGGLERADEVLGKTRYLTGSQVTEADIRLFTTLVRFDAVYNVHFKCNMFKIAERPNLQGFVKDMYQFPGVKETVNIEQIKRHYYASHTQLNPAAIIPKGPILDFESPHGREDM